MEDLSDEIAIVTRLLIEDPETSRISPDGKRLFMLVEGQLLCLQGPKSWTEMTEDEVNGHLERARLRYFASIEEEEVSKDAS